MISMGQLILIDARETASYQLATKSEAPSRSITAASFSEITPVKTSPRFRAEASAAVPMAAGSLHAHCFPNQAISRTCSVLCEISTSHEESADRLA